MGRFNARRANMVIGLLQISATPLPSAYLGVPLFFGSARHIYFQKTLDSIRSKLVGWKTECLSFAGRLALVRHVLSSIPFHISLVLPLPSKTSLQSERPMRNFLWSANPDKSRSSLVRWDTVCLPKAEGGLGLRRVREFNEACLLFLAWSAISVDSVWANWFRGRYFKGLPIWYSKNPRNGSCIWKKLRGLSSLLQKDCRWIVSNGQSVNLWFDNWIDDDPIASNPDFHFSEKDCVAGIIEDNRWLIPGHLPTKMQVVLTNSIRSISLGDTSVPNLFSWKCNSSFSIREALYIF
eukprot:TRINITY_DN14077_c0_g1_i14.p1 TRINITY_DN14077_c0_g1~~TRINITY_DN14077_c0_g1_i14.p1  ORF type:complete len:294 (+),score=44.57 TRINITY_DN14077_c0_g1_i14:1403-2284(+)